MARSTFSQGASDGYRTLGADRLKGSSDTAPRSFPVADGSHGLIHAGNQEIDALRADGHSGRSPLAKAAKQRVLSRKR